MSIFDMFQNAAEKLRSASMEMNKRAQEFNRKTEIRVAVLEGLSKLRSDADLEKILLRSALRHAELHAEIDAKGPEFRKIFDELLQGSDSREGEDGADFSDRSVPNFAQLVSHPDEDVFAAIQYEAERLRGLREEFLRDMRLKLSENKSLRPHFRSHLVQIGAAQFLNELDPAAEWIAPEETRSSG